MFAVLAVALRLLSPPGSSDWDTYVVGSMGSMYPLVEYGCQRKEDALKVAYTYHDKGHSEAWKLILALSKEVSADGRAMCLKIDGDFVFTSIPAFETDVEIQDGGAGHLSVVHAHTAMGNSYWLLMLNSHFVLQ
jgi:hypothetical protein